MTTKHRLTRSERLDPRRRRRSARHAAATTSTTERAPRPACSLKPVLTYGGCREPWPGPQTDSAVLDVLINSSFVSPPDQQK